MSDVLIPEEHAQTIFECASVGDISAMRAMLESGVDINSVHPANGMSALHYAIGRHNIEMVRYLINQQARFFPDRLGRMPSSIASMMQCSEEMNDLVVEAEMRNSELQTDGSAIPEPKSLEDLKIRAQEFISLLESVGDRLEEFCYHLEETDPQIVDDPNEFVNILNSVMSSMAKDMTRRNIALVKYSLFRVGPKVTQEFLRMMKVKLLETVQDQTRATFRDLEDCKNDLKTIEEAINQADLKGGKSSAA